MTKRILFHIAAVNHQTQPDHRKEARQALWAQAIAAAHTAKEFRRWLYDEGSWEEGDDAISF